MIRRIVLDNFMSHAHTVIEPADGLTVLAGPNNCGKSAVVVALQTLCGRHAGDFMVRHGQKECSVTVETDDGHVIRWRRKGSVVSYNIDGTDYHRAGRQVPEDVDRLLRLPKVTDADGNASFEIHFADQKQPIFLLDQTGRQAATFFASSSDAALLMEMQRRHKDKVRDERAREKHLAGQVEDLTQQIEALAPAEDLDDRLTEVERAHEALLQQARDLAALGEAIAGLRRQAATTNQAATRAKALAALKAPPVLHEVAPLDDLIEAIERRTQQIDTEQGRVRAMAGLAEPPALEPTGPLEQLCRAIDTCRREVTRQTVEVKCLADLSRPPEQHDVQTLATVVRALDAAGANAAGFKRQVASLTNLHAVPQLADETVLAGQIDGLQAALKHQSARKEQVRCATAEVCAAEQAIRDWAQANPVCRLCGAVIDADRLVAGGGHAHGA